MIDFFDDIKRIYPELIEEWMRLDDYEPWQIIEGVSKTRIIDAINSFNYLDVDITKNLTLLDIGCECGLYSMPATQKFKRVIGIDSDEVAIKRALKTKDIFIKNGYDVSNFEAKHISFEKYCINPKYQVDKKSFTDTIWNSEKHDLIINSDFENDNINAILACEILSLFDDNLMNIFNKVLENVKLIMIQSNNTKVDKWNSYKISLQDEIIEYLKQQGFSKIEIVSPGLNHNYVSVSIREKFDVRLYNCGIIIGKK
jgi:hypothetical protein